MVPITNAVTTGRKKALCEIQHRDDRSGHQREGNDFSAADDRRLIGLAVRHGRA
jgi:hypothetical protein